jgi:hypothetical protein
LIAIRGEAAKAAARVNVSALALGQQRIVPAERHFSVERLRDAITRGGEDLALIRRAVSGLIERTAPMIERLSRGPDTGRER